MRRFTVEVEDRTFQTLARIALEERRDVRDQAALVLEQAVRQVEGEAKGAPLVLSGRDTRPAVSV